MTRQEFIDDITTWSELIDFCHDENIDYCDNVYSDESYDDHINDELEDVARNEGWQDVREWLTGLPSGYDYYIKNDWDEWEAADDDVFDDIRDEVIEYMDNNDCWDEDEEEEIEEYTDPEDETPVEDEGVSFAELFTTCSSKVQKIESDKVDDAIAAEQAEAMAFDELCVSVGIAVAVEGSN